MDKINKMMNLIKCCNAGGITTKRSGIESAWNGKDAAIYLSALVKNGMIKIEGSDARIRVL